MNAPQPKPSLAAAPIDHHDEVAQLIREIHAERQEAKDREIKERWLIWVSLMIVAFAVVAAIGAQQDGSISTAMMLKQQQASDTWSQYQANSFKAHMAEMEGRLAATPEGKKAAKDGADKYRKAQKPLKEKAEELEGERDLAGKQDGPLSRGVAILQVSIALASVCLITKKKMLLVAAGLFGFAGSAYVIYGLFFF